MPIKTAHNNTSVNQNKCYYVHQPIKGVLLDFKIPAILEQDLGMLLRFVGKIQVWGERWGKGQNVFKTHRLDCYKGRGGTGEWERKYDTFLFPFLKPQGEVYRFKVCIL